MKFANSDNSGAAAMGGYTGLSVRAKTCTQCGLSQRANIDCIPSKGTNNPHIFFVGDNPGAEEDRQGTSFVGKPGKLLEEIIAKVNIDPRYTRMGNVVRCFPKNPDNSPGKPTTAEVKTCVAAHLLLEIAQQRPGVIVALGKTASETLTGNRSAIERMRGFKHPFVFPNYFIEWAETQGMILYEAIPEKTGGIPPQRFDPKTCKSIEYPVVVTYHPSAALRQREANIKGWIEADLIYARQSVYKEDKLPGVDYRFVNTVDSLNAWTDYLVGYWRSGQAPYFAIDIETGGQDDEAGLREFDPQSEIVSIQVTWREKFGICIPVSHPEGNMNNAFGIAAIRNFLYRIFVEEGVPAVNQNIGFDYKHIFAKFGVRLAKIVFDTQMAHQCLYAGDEPNGLDYIAAKYSGMQGYGDGLLEKKAKLPKGKKVFNNLPLDRDYLEYAVGDTDAVFRAIPPMTEELKQKELWWTFNHCLMDALIPLAEMETNGLPIDREVHQWLGYEMPKQLEAIKEPIRHSPFYPTYLQSVGCPPEQVQFLIDGTAPKHVKKDYDFNPGSTDQKVKLIFGVMQLPKNPERLTDAGSPSTDKAALKELHETCVANGWTDHAKVVAAVQEYSVTSKLHSAYIQNLPDVVQNKGEPCHDLFAPYRPKELIEWCVNPLYKQDGTDTGRLSAARPAIHGMPQKSAVKRLFKSRWREQGGLHLQFDYSAMEVRVLACRAMANCPNLKNAFSQGFDAHKYVASMIFGKPIDQITPDERKVCKTVNFAVLYGAGPDNVAGVVGCTRAKAEKFIADYLEALPAVTRWKAGMEQFALRRGHVRSAFGRVRHLSTKMYAKGDIERRAVNTPIQSTASDVTLTSYVRIFYKLRELGYRSLPYLCIHDSLGFDVFPGEFFSLWELLHYEMAIRPPQIYDWLDVPLQVDSDAGYSWGTMVGLERFDATNWKISGKENYCAAMVAQLQKAGHHLTYTVKDEVADNKPVSAWYLSVTRS